MLLPGAMPARANRAVHVLSRTVIGPKQQLLLIQIGQRLVAVGDNGAQLTALCQITDPDEVASLIGQTRSAGRGEDTPFSPVLGKAAAAYERDERADFSALNVDRPAEAGASESNARSDRAAERSDSAIDIDLRQSAETDLHASTNTPEIAQTRDELSGLTERVKRLARQFGQS